MLKFQYFSQSCGDVSVGMGQKLTSIIVADDVVHIASRPCSSNELNVCLKML